jgi:hypothetical protein
VSDPLDLPPAPEWAGDAISFREALDSWLAELHLRCEDPDFVKRYREAMGEAVVETPLHPHPNVGDEIGWRGWWKHCNRVFSEAGASAGGIDDPPTPHRLSRKGRRKRWRKAVARVVRQVLVEELPEAVRLLTGRAPQ